MNFIVTVASHKGGVGKTTTVLNVGYSLARGGGRVLLVDADPQGGLGHATHLAARRGGGLVQALSGALPLEAAILKTRIESLSVLGCGVEEAPDVTFLEDAARDGSLGRLLRALPDGFDHVLVDAPAGTGGMLHGLLSASDGLLAVTSPKALSVRSIPALLRAHELAERDNPHLKFVGLLITMIDGLQRSDWTARQQLAKELPAGALFRVAIPFELAVEDASQQCLPLALSERAMRSAEAYAQAAVELRARTHQRPAAPAEGRPYGLF